MNEQIQQEIKEVDKRIEKVIKESGFGEVVIKIQNGHVVYITHSIGEQMGGDKKQ